MLVKIRQDETIRLPIHCVGGEARDVIAFQGRVGGNVGAFYRVRGVFSATTADVYSVAKPEWSRSAFFTARDKGVSIWVQSFSGRWRVLPLWRVGGWGKQHREREGK